MCNCTVLDARLKGVVAVNIRHCFNEEQRHDARTCTEDEEGERGASNK
jgi:hypothetical protein